MFYARYEFNEVGYVQQLRPHSLHGAKCAAQHLAKESAPGTPLVVTDRGCVVCRFTDGKWRYTLPGFKYSPAYMGEDNFQGQHPPRTGGIMECQKYPAPCCDNCGRCCASDDGWCPDWMPCRGGHPSTPNPCECSSYEEYDLCLGACAGCPHIHWEE